MNLDDLIDEYNNNYSPEWAFGRTSGEYVLGAQLPTRDGRRTGNAHIVDIDDGGLEFEGVICPIYTILTDAGNLIRMIRPEIEEAFYPPHWVSDVDDVLRKFGR